MLRVQGNITKILAGYAPLNEVLLIKEECFMPLVSFEDTINKIENACCGAKIKQHLDDVDEANMLCNGIIEDYEFPIISQTVNDRLIELGEKK